MLILVGYTHRPESRAALERAIEEARLRQASLHIMRTLPEVVNDIPNQVSDWTDRVEAARNEGAAIEADLREQGIDASFELKTVPDKDLATELLEAAEDLEADLIVLGLRRRSPVGKLVLGSVSQQVLLKANCPVLAVKIDEG